MHRYEIRRDIITQNRLLKAFISPSLPMNRVDLETPSDKAGGQYSDISYIEL